LFYKKTLVLCPRALPHDRNTVLSYFVFMSYTYFNKSLYFCFGTYMSETVISIIRKTVTVKKWVLVRCLCLSVNR